MQKIEKFLRRTRARLPSVETVSTRMNRGLTDKFLERYNESATMSRALKEYLAQKYLEGMI